jgi:hypothetical protein
MQGTDAAALAVQSTSLVTVGTLSCRPCQTHTAPHLHIWTSRLQPAAVAQALERGVRPQNDVLDSFSKEQVREFGDVELDPHM